MALLIASTIAACESTQDKAAKLQASGSAAFSAKGLRITELSKDVKVGRTAVLRDDNGIAVVVELRNTTDKTLEHVPVAIDVVNAKGKSLFRNNDPGLARALVSMPLLRPKQRAFWVHDQVFATGRPAKVKVKVGQAPPAPRKLPDVDVSPPRFEQDPVSGLSVSGKALNRSGLLQKEFTLFAVARKGRRIVAAGRGAIERLKPRKDAGWQVFFIGNPRGAKVELAAPPTVLK